MTTTVKYFHSAMLGAPVLNGVAGSLISVLDACLIDGFGLKSATSLVVAGGVATLTFATAHAFEADAIMLIAGATPGGLNGEQRVIASTSLTASFATGLADQTATGTITCKLAPAGWAKEFTGTNLAVYRSADVTGTRMRLRCDDTDATNSRVVGYESMSDVNTGVQAFPSLAQISGGYYWPKASAAGATARAWTLISDAKTFWLYLHTATASLGTAGYTGGFGDFASVKSGDAYACHLFGSSTDIAASTSPTVANLSHSYTDSLAPAGFAVARSFTGLGSSVLPVKRAESYVGTDGHSGTTANVAGYPNGPDNSLLLSRIMILESAPHLRGVLRGPMFAPQNCHAAFNWRDKIDGQGVYSGRKFMGIKGAGDAAGTVSSAVVFFDITGPWG